MSYLPSLMTGYVVRLLYGSKGPSTEISSPFYSIYMEGSGLCCTELKSPLVHADRDDLHIRFQIFFQLHCSP